jgi:hypothetical protein
LMQGTEKLMENALGGLCHQSVQSKHFRGLTP